MVPQRSVKLSEGKHVKVINIQIKSRIKEETGSLKEFGPENRKEALGV